MRTVLYVVLGIVGVFFITIYLAGEQGGEVVRLTTTDAQGASHETPLWVVDLGAALWLRAGDPESRWLARLRAHPDVTLERNRIVSRYRAVPVPEMSARVDAAMAEKYGLADRLIGTIRPEGQSVAVRLDPIPE